MHRLHIALAACTAIAAAPGAARAHAFLDHADPRVGSTVHNTPTAVTLTFTEAVEAKFCRVTISNAEGKPVDTGPVEQPAPTQLRLTLTPLASGTYTVHWAVTSVDTHQSQGTFEFTVAP